MGSSVEGSVDSGSIKWQPTQLQKKEEMPTPETTSKASEVAGRNLIIGGRKGKSVVSGIVGKENFPKGSVDKNLVSVNSFLKRMIKGRKAASSGKEQAKSKSAVDRYVGAIKQLPEFNKNIKTMTRHLLGNFILKQSVEDPTLFQLRMVKDWDGTVEDCYCRITENGYQFDSNDFADVNSLIAYVKEKVTSGQKVPSDEQKVPSEPFRRELPSPPMPSTPASESPRPVAPSPVSPRRDIRPVSVPPKVPPKSQNLFGDRRGVCNTIKNLKQEIPRLKQEIRQLQGEMENLGVFKRSRKKNLETKLQGLQRNLDEKTLYLDKIILPREHPGISRADTLVIREGKLQSMHGKGTCFLDEEILHLHNVKKTEDLGAGVVAKISESGKNVIQQRGARGCTAAVAAMLIRDRGGTPNVKAMDQRSLAGSGEICLDIRNAGFTPIHTERVDNLEHLKRLLEENGSAIVDINDKRIGSHVIIVDEIRDEDVRIRDPYHGWEISVTLDAFKDRFFGFNAIQIKS
ncbi:MAG: hypothetical protein K940chlam7_01675 [Chlamydiae bacterium]|nr:hypothetical protein [Chlamydiota bacterium]